MEKLNKNKYYGLAQLRALENEQKKGIENGKK